MAIDLKPGTTVSAKYKGGQYLAIVEKGEPPMLKITESADAKRVAVDATFKSLSAAGKAVTGSETNGRKFWTVYTGDAPAEAEATEEPKTTTKRAGRRRESAPAASAEGEEGHAQNGNGAGEVTREPVEEGA